MMRLGRHEPALAWLDELLAEQPVAWARLDKVRCLQARHQAGAAMQQLKALIEATPAASMPRTCWAAPGWARAG
jgi:hypothetical protein